MLVELSRVQELLRWLDTKLFLDSKAASSKPRIVKRGEVYKCNFGRGIGSEMSKERPAVVIQNDIGNIHSPNTIVVPITHDTSNLPCMSPITPKADANGATILDGQANTSNVMCVSKARLGDYICDLTSSEMKSIDEKLASQIGLIGYYSAVKAKLKSKNEFIAKLKAERNSAQDELLNIRKVLGLTDEESIADKLSEMKKCLDKQVKV